jgi:hypothetical protein
LWNLNIARSSRDLQAFSGKKKKKMMMMMMMKHPNPEPQNHGL